MHKGFSSPSPSNSPKSSRKNTSTEEEIKLGYSPTKSSQLSKEPFVTGFASSPKCQDMYHNLPDLHVKPLRTTNPIVILSGPDESGSAVDYQDIASAEASSTYPVLPGYPNRVADPVCDVFNVKLYENRGIIALADGCSWGHRPREAALKASAAFMNYVDAHHNEMKDIRDAGHYLLRAFERASKEIVLGKDFIWDAGTTTLLGGVVLELEDDRWCFVCVNVGDCKAFRWSQQSGEVDDITIGNRANLTDAKDPGGRLGPWSQNGTDDLRNLKLYYVEVEPGDLLIVVSDGIHDNFDPQHLGKTPLDFQLKFDTWEDAEKQMPKEVEEAKNLFRKTCLKDKIDDIIANDPSSSQHKVHPKAINKKLLNYCFTLTESSRKFMVDFPNKKLPSDFAEYPGKMDHTTAVTIRVGSIQDPSAQVSQGNNINLIEGHASN